MSLHEDRARAESFGEDAERYDRARPSYPPELIDDLVDADTARVLDVGCGTGIASRLFVERGCTVIGVEQDERMAAVARRRGVDVDVATFEQWEPRGAPFDLIASAQAWHWVDPVVGRVKAGALLRPGGRFAAFWNVSHHEQRVRDAFTRIYARHAPHLVERSTALGTIPSEWSVPVGDELRKYEWRHTYTRDEWLDQLPTHSDHRLLDAGTRAALLADIGGAIDDLGGAITVTYVTGLLTWTRAYDSAMDNDAAREHLVAERDRLNDVKESLDGIDDESENESLSELSDLDQHQADVGTETFDRERDLSILDQVEGELGDVERALQKLDEGTYGKCEACGEPIEDERLEALPAARYCVKHQAVAERPSR